MVMPSQPSVSDAADWGERLKAARPLTIIMPRLADLTPSIPLANRRALKSFYRPVHILAMSTPVRFEPSPTLDGRNRRLLAMEHRGDVVHDRLTVIGARLDAGGGKGRFLDRVVNLVVQAGDQAAYGEAPGRRVRHGPRRHLRDPQGGRLRPADRRADEPRPGLVGHRPQAGPAGGHGRARPHACLPRRADGPPGRETARHPRRLRDLVQTHRDPRHLAHDHRHAGRPSVRRDQRARSEVRVGRASARVQRLGRAGGRRHQRARPRRARRDQPRPDRQGQGQGARAGHQAGHGRPQGQRGHRGGAAGRVRRVPEGRTPVADAGRRACAGRHPGHHRQGRARSTIRAS